MQASIEQSIGIKSRAIAGAGTMDFAFGGQHSRGHIAQSARTRLRRKKNQEGLYRACARFILHCFYASCKITAYRVTFQVYQKINENKKKKKERKSVLISNTEHSM